MALTIQPFVNKHYQQRFRVVIHLGNTFLDANGHGYFTKQSAYRGMVFFFQQQKQKKLNTKNLKK